MSAADIEQLRTRLSAVIETRTTILGGRTLGALTVEQIKKVGELEEREAALHREIAETQSKDEPMTQKTPTPREARAAQRKAILAGRTQGELSARELFELTTLDDLDELDALHASGAISPNMSAADIAAVRNRSARRDDAR